ncbi:hypothetical protein [Methanococcoides seepicolus]|uniref:Apea-like HEPN domain-containing protein n=1 Tax=Methanococcoides seepicolus TaxID=2828780 RepID=A0A9E5DCU6_9EURY|nr:hypothetical protein [Methanococcoides seepicolus]MCM1987294.1 hypothetical protein [Methanococcoides seepicolus]
MDLYLWNSYQKAEITEKIKYWVDLWDEINEDLDKNTYDEDLVNPHLLVINLLDEIKYNRLKNKRINKYLLEKFNFFLKNDQVIKNSFATDFKLIISELSNGSKRFEYCIMLCEQTIESIQCGSYFKESCDLLKKIIMDTHWKDGEEEEISLISQNLIIELILAGYSLEKIKSIPQNLFSKYEIIKTDNGEFLRTDYPTSIDFKKYDNDDLINNISYNEALKDEIDSLSIADRIDRLKYYFDQEYREGYGIFHIEGLIGNIDVNIVEVNFYSPKIENYMSIINDSEYKAKDFNQKKLEFYDNQNLSLINAAVKVKYRDFESAKRQTLESIEKTLDLLRLYINSETAFRVKIDRFYLVDCDDFGVSESHSAKEQPHIKKLNSFDLSDTFFSLEVKDENILNIEKLLLNENSQKMPLSAKLIYSLHWYRKAFESNVIEDKLLNYWIVIENLITFDSQNENLVLRDKEERDKFTLVEELVPFIELSCSLRNVAIDTYLYLDHLINSSQVNPSTHERSHYLEIPSDCLDACQLGSLTDKIQIDFVKFIEKLHLLNPYIEKKVIENKIKFADKFYNDTKFTRLELIKKLEQTKKDLLLIYRYRNLIVHNAHFDNTILPYYAMKAENIARNLLQSILDQHAKDSTIAHQKLLLKDRVKMEIMIEKLKNDIPVDLWNLK